LHPDEPELLKNNRVLGWGPARAFGDGEMKWSAALQNRLMAAVLRSTAKRFVKTPPYFTAEPEVTTFEGVRRGDFLVLASDGLWESLTNEEVVGLVGKWLEEKGSKENIRLAEEDMEVIVPNKVYPSTTIGLPRLDKTDAENSIQVKE
jgi:pyruvate dehydrogenase phosphatase